MGLGEDVGEGKAEDGDVVVRCEGVFEVALVEDVAFRRLDDDQDAGGEGGRGYGWSVGVVGGGEAVA